MGLLSRKDTSTRGIVRSKLSIRRVLLTDPPGLELPERSYIPKIPVCSPASPGTAAVPVLGSRSGVSNSVQT